MTTQSIEGAMPPLPERNRLMTLTAPRTIWLNVFTDDHDGEFPDNHEGITWCDDDAGDVDVPYIRADLAAPLLARVAELQAERDRMKDALEWVRGHISRYDPPGLPNHVAQRIDAALAAHKEQP